jgi:hypothetical protein
VLGFFRAALSRKGWGHLKRPDSIGGHGRRAKGKDSPPHFAKNRMLTPELGVAHQSKHPPARWIFVGYQQIARQCDEFFLRTLPAHSEIL